MLVSSVVTLFVAIQDPIVQRFAVRFAGGYLSEKTGADIKVGRIAVSPDFRVFVDNVSVKDLNGNDLAKVGKLRAKFHIADLLEGNIHLGQVELKDTDANLIKYEGEEGFNFKFLVDFFGPRKEKDPDKEPMPLLIDHISLKNVNFMLWNQDKADSTKTAQNRIDYAHLVLDNINLEARHFALVGDSVFTVVEMLRANEMSGLELKHFQSDVVVCQKGIFLNDMQMETNNSLFHLDLNMKYDSYKAFKNFVNAVEFDATIHPTDAMLSDIGYFAPVMYKMPNRVQLEGVFSGPISSFRLNDMDLRFGKSTVIKGDLTMHPLDFKNGYHTLDVKKMHFTYDDLVQFHIPGKTGTIPLPEKLNTLKSGDVRLKFRGSYNNFDSDITVISDVANLKATVNRSKKGEKPGVFTGNIDAQRLNAGMFVKSNLIGKLDVNAGFSFSLPKGGSPTLGLDGSIRDAELLGNHIDEIVLNGDMRENRFNGKLNVDDDELYLDFNGLIDFSDKKNPKSDFEAVIRDADLSSLNIMKGDSVSVVSTKIYANMTGFKFDDLEGTLHLDSTVYRDSRGVYVMNSFDARIVNDNLMQRRINLNNDFFDFEMAGKVNFASLMMSLNAYGDRFVHFPIWEENLEKFEKYKQDHDVDQDFFAKLYLKNTRTLSRLFMPSLQIAENTSVNATFTSRSNQLNLTARSKKVCVGDVVITDIELKNNNFLNSAFGTLSVGGVEWTNMTKKDTLVLGLDNIVMSARMANDTIATRIVWDDASLDDHNKALIRASFHPHESGGILNIRQADVVVNDSLWQLSPDNYINFDKGRVELSNILLSHKRQSLRADGYVPTGVEDTLSLQLNGFDISLLDFFTSSRGLGFDGLISGKASLGSLKHNPMVLADLVIDSLGVNGNHVGDVTLLSHWVDESKAVNVDLGILRDDKKTLSVLGAYYTKRKEDNLDFKMRMDSLDISVASVFTAGQITRLKGLGVGEVSLTGSLKQPQLEGAVSIYDGGCKVTYLNTYYSFTPTLLLTPTEIKLQDMVLVDTLGNKAPVVGSIHHNYLKDFSLDLRLRPSDFLVMATTLKNNDSYYGSVVTNGWVSVKGPVKDIALNAYATTRKGTQLTLPLNRVSTVRDNDFIVFVNNSEEMEEEEEIIVGRKKKADFAINLDMNVTDDAGVKIYLPGDIGTIDATGHGNLKIGTSSAEALSLYGAYVINNGVFMLNFKNLLEKRFTLQQGGTITWAGSPRDGRINATGVYSAKASLNTLGIQVDSTSTSGNVSVDCMIHLSDALLNPTITFGMRLPNATEEVQQTVFSVIDTTNQAIMSAQVISLLVFNSFSYAGSSSGLSGISALGAFTSNLISANMNLNLGLDFDVGVKYVVGQGSNSYDEFQVALKTELFENRLIIETNLGVLTDNKANENASNLVGELDMYYKLFKDGRLMAHFYNHSNYGTYASSFTFDRLAPYTQGLGLTYSKSFSSFRDLFKRKQTTPLGNPTLNRPVQKEKGKP